MGMVVRRAMGYIVPCVEKADNTRKLTAKSEQIMKICKGEVIENG